MITLAGLELNREMVWADRFVAMGPGVTYKRTLGGRVVALPSSKTQRPVTLIAQQDHGWLTRAQVEALIAMAEVANAQYLLTYYDTSFLVRFAVENPPAVEMQSLIIAANPKPDSYFVGTIKLITL